MRFAMKPAAGFTLLEVLVTLLILSIGLLGLAGLQITGLRSSQNSYYRLQATLLAQDLSERMRANKAGVSLGAYDAAPDGASAADCTSAVCSPEQMAAYDLAQWRADIAKQLPAGSGEICRGAPSCGTGPAFTVTIRWYEKRAGAQPREFTTSFQP
ncbi:type IV pilus modification protein PilV [Candidatus Methylospira mobilis]|uniref:type IV pilus modification protein PilV n=1 Tax=Candidatus Methylospira mobilis TaxID=1808979 RepID=UPI0028E41127|nr:type IV pilus modification protein PilV [Candidatus Methylospira mobilis]WNV06472.1 type IV pilus modification protein PilV [Candidatus Methylospira mobilis]